MKKIEAMIQHFKLDEVREALINAGINGITVSEVQGCGHQRGYREVYRGAEYDLELVPKLTIEVVVADDHLQAALDAITVAAHTGKVGDGRISIAEVVDVIRIRTSERGMLAL